jgi:hypothetical protein
VITDDYQPIYNPKLGEHVGFLKVTLAMGTPGQINRHLNKESASQSYIDELKFKKKLEKV